MFSSLAKGEEQEWAKYTTTDSTHVLAEHPQGRRNAVGKDGNLWLDSTNRFKETELVVRPHSICVPRDIENVRTEPF